MADDLAPAPITAPDPDMPLAIDERVAATVACINLRDAEAEVRRCEAALVEAKAYQRYLAEVIVPDALHHAQLSSMTLDTGERITIEHRLHCRIVAGRKQDVLTWLKELGRSDLCSVTMSATFVRNEYAKARSFAQRAAICLGEEKPVRIDEAWDVHSATLKKFIGDTFFAPGKLAEIHEGIDYFNHNVAVVTGPVAPTENPLDA